jgi:two-component system, NarL family, sensor histidine kinase DesK
MRLLPESGRKELGWTPYVWLFYLSFFLLEAALRPMPLAWRAAALFSVPLFLFLYFRGYWVWGRRLLPVVAAIVALGVLLMPTVPSAAVFFIYGAAFVGRLGPPRVGVRALLLIVLVALAETWLFGLPPYAWMPAVIVSLLIGGPNIHFAEAQRQREKLRLAEDEIAHLAKVAERERIARDLHDLLGHTLSVIVLKSELASKLAARDPLRAAAEIGDVERISREALAEVRRAVQGYRSRGLRAELDAARPALDAAGIELAAELPELRLAPATEGVLALALREAITNVVRHSGARQCRVRLESGDGRVRLEVRDDGRGGSAPEGAGLAGMRERALALGGELLRETGSGTRLLVSLPFAGEAT